MSLFTILFVITAACDVLGEGGRRRGPAAVPADSTGAQSGGTSIIVTSGSNDGYNLGSAAAAISGGQGYQVTGAALEAAPVLGNVAGSSAPLNNAAAVGAAQLSAIQNAQAVQVAQIANAAAAAIQGARVAEVAARAGQANALQNAQAFDATRIANVQRARAAAYENARAAEAARRAAAAAAAEVARAVEAERIANAARVQAVAIANARAIEASRIANAARAQAAAVATSAAQAQAVAEAVARNTQDGTLLLGAAGGLANNVAPVAVGGGYSYGGLGGGWNGYAGKGRK
ncbi:tol-Pal system protein TolA-like [Maniola jurtina]|uniref:tol-Pal system protein TolA-like n=1 Tax=Maniola jurtina TaxID=191418 RepID=UPI001E6869D9|nr:tol-Pal system protein TolA-like [Maniola jurtina]